MSCIRYSVEATRSQVPALSAAEAGEPRPEVLSARDRSRLCLQRFLGWIFLLPLSSLIVLVIRVGFRLKIEDHAAIRAAFRDIARTNRPLIICANHLTMVDSVLIMWGLGSVPYYFRNYRLFSWNIPAIENYRSRVSMRIVTYLSKCIPIDRSGIARHIESVLEKLRHLLKRGDVCLIFPEGSRSRTGRVEEENVTYGLGKILSGVPDCKILCVYLRGRRQRGYSMLPFRGDTLSLTLRMYAPASAVEGMRGIRDVSVETIKILKAMEDSYFAHAAPLDR